MAFYYMVFSLTFVPVKSLDTLSHSSEWEGVCKLLAGIVYDCTRACSHSKYSGVILLENKCTFETKHCILKIHLILCRARLITN